MTPPESTNRSNQLPDNYQDVAETTSSWHPADSGRDSDVGKEETTTFLPRVPDEEDEDSSAGVFDFGGEDVSRADGRNGGDLSLAGELHSDTSYEYPQTYGDLAGGDLAGEATPWSSRGATHETGTGVMGGTTTKEHTSVNTAAGQAQDRTPPSALRRPGRGPRRASLQVKRFDPWSVLKLAIVLGIATFLVWMVAVGLLYTVLDGMGVWDQINGTYASLVAGEPAEGAVDPLITGARVFGFAAVVGGINIVLVAALATVGAFIYNISADLAGGLELTLSERE